MFFRLRAMLSCATVRRPSSNDERFEEAPAPI
jgi:hypothetical protein